jgi:CheY-like chemotaxis protein
MSKTILLVEDSPDDELFFKIALRKAGVENPVRSVRDGRQAIAYLCGNPPFGDRQSHPLPEIIFLDLKLPCLDGFGVLEWLRLQPELTRRILIVILSQIADAAVLQRAYALGANSFLIKPCMDEELRNLVNHYDGYWIRSQPGRISPDPPPLEGPGAPA